MPGSLVTALRGLLRPAGISGGAGLTGADFSAERNRRALLAGAVSALSRGVGIIALLISTPVTLGYLGIERFSVWITITSFAALFSVADIGLGNGLMNAVARCHAKGDAEGLKAYTSTALVLLSVIGVVGVVLALGVAPLIPWTHVLAVESPTTSPAEVTATMMAFILCLALAVPASVIQKVQFSLQLGYLASLWQLAGTIAGLIALLVAIWLRLGLPWLVAGWLGAPALVALVSAFVFWGVQRPDYRPALSRRDRSMARELMRVGGLFFVLQIAGATAFSSDNLILAHVLGPQAVAQYAVTSRLLEGVMMISALFLTPLWPAYAEAFTRGDAAWVKGTLAKSMLLTAALTAGVAFLITAGSRWITHVWVGDAVLYSMTLFVVYSLWIVIKATGNAFSMFLNGVGWIGFQTILAVIFATTVTVLKIRFGQSLGVIGVPLALILAYCVTVVIPYAIRMPRLIRGIRGVADAS